MKKFMVEVLGDFAESKKIPQLPALVLKGPYEYQIKLTENLTSCEMMYDLLIDGIIYKQIPCKLCRRIKTQY